MLSTDLKSRRDVLGAGLLTLLGLLSRAQTPVRPANSDTSTARLIDDVKALPPEFAADCLIRLAASLRHLSKEQRVGLLAESFHLAAGATYPVRKRALPGSNTDARDGSLSNAFDLGLDTASLQAHAVESMLAIDTGRSGELFDHLSPLYPPLSCSDRLVYDVEAYYRVADLVRPHPPVPRSGVDHETNHFVSRLIGLMANPAQVPHLARIVSSLPEAEMQNALPIFTAALPRVQRDTRAFEVFAGDTFHHIAILVKASYERAIANAGLIEAARIYLLNQTSAGDCAFNGDHQKSWLRNFSQLVLWIYPAGAAYHELTEAELRGTGTRQSQTPALFWQSRASQVFLADFKAIRYGLSNSSERANRFGEYLSKLELWPGSEEDEAIYFHEKCILMESVLREENLDPGDRNRGLLSLMAFIGEDRFKSLGPEWFAQAKEALPLVDRYGPNSNTDRVLWMYQSLEARIAEINRGK